MSSWNLRYTNYRQAAFLAAYVIQRGVLLRNRKTRMFKFGKSRDEVKLVKYNDIPIVYFMGSDTQLNAEVVVDTYKEWKSNYDLYKQGNVQELHTFVDEVYDSLPQDFKTPRVVLVGYSRGGFTMSAYSSLHASCAAIYVACPGELYDCRKKARAVYSFGHILDPVYMISAKHPLHVHTRIVFRNKMNQTTQEVVATVHLKMVLWLDDIASNSEMQRICA